MFIDGEGYRESVFHILASLPDDQRCRFAMMIWCLWKRRNEKVWEGIEKPAQISLQCSFDFFLGWQHAQRSKLAHSQAATVRNRHIHTPWTCPDSGSLKCNVDAGIFEDDKYGIGLCLRDGRGFL